LVLTWYVIISWDLSIWKVCHSLIGLWHITLGWNQINSGKKKKKKKKKSVAMSNISQMFYDGTYKYIMGLMSKTDKEQRENISG